MWIEFREVESACEQEDHGTNRGEPAVATRLALGGLEQSVEGFEEAVGLARLRPGNDPFQMVACWRAVKIDQLC